jgi:hypothetical protein
MSGLDIGLLSQIGDGSGDLKNTMKGARRQIKFLYRLFKQIHTSRISATKLLNFLRA